MNELTLSEAMDSGLGCYSLSEVAYYARIHPNTLRAWFFHPDAPRFRERSNRFSEKYFLTFIDLIEAIYVRKLRKEYRVPMKYIRQAILTYEKEYGTVNFFAHPGHRTVVDGKIICIVNEDQLVALSHQPGQLIDYKIVKGFTENLVFDEDDNIQRYIAYTEKRRRDAVFISPTYSLGEPVLKNSGYTVAAICNACRVEGGIKPAAEAYAIPEYSVRTALQYSSMLAQK